MQVSSGVRLSANVTCLKLTDDDKYYTHSGLLNKDISHLEAENKEEFLLNPINIAPKFD
jgi:hypothetical protein